MYLKNEIKVFFNSIISYLLSKQVYLLEKLESIIIHLFLTNGEILDLRETDSNKPVTLLTGQSVIWEYGSINEPILETFDTSNRNVQSNIPVFSRILRLIRFLIIQINFYFYLDELYMDGYFEADATDYSKSRLHPGRRISVAPNSSIISMCQWLNIQPSNSNIINSYNSNNKDYNEHNLNNNLNRFLTKLGLLPIHSKDTQERMIYNKIPSFIPLFKYPIAYGIRE